MLTINGNIVAKDYTGDIIVEGINMYNPDAVQFSLYTLVDADEDVRSILGLNENNDNMLLVFPFQCGIKFTSGHHILNVRDCLGVISKENIINLWK